MSVLCGILLTSRCAADTYLVGPGESYATVSQCRGKLKPGDVVEVTGDIDDFFTLDVAGARDTPLVVRGRIRVEGGRTIRPRVRIPDGAPHGIVCNGGSTIIEGLDISGARGKGFRTGSAILHACSDLTVRNCRIHHNAQGIFGDFHKSGNTLIEFCEFDSNGSDLAGSGKMHSVYLNSTWRGATAIVQFCWFHDATEGAFVRSRCSRNIIRYNWFENHFYNATQITGLLSADDEQSDAFYPSHSDIIGNVYHAGWSPGPRWSILSLGGESSEAPGTEGAFVIAHNLFILTNSESDPSVAVLVHGNVDKVTLLNNSFMGLGVAGFAPYRYISQWADARSAKWRQRHGGSEPILTAKNNWICPQITHLTGVGVAHGGTAEPRLVNLLDGGMRPRWDSSLAGAGLWPLPQGAVTADIAPEFEPQRGIPTDLRGLSRRKATPPSIGPFEADRQPQEAAVRSN